MSQNPTENLRRGRRRIEEIPEIILLKDWTWDVVTKRFYLHIRVCLDHDGKDIPRVTEWFVTAETVYPFGTIAIYPSCKNSITNTFPHQSINAFEEENHLWRKGKLCVDLIDQTLGIRVPEKEPFTVDERLFWNMQRAVLWLRAAAEERLIKNGDAFELPDFPVSHIQTVFAFQEDCVSMMIWESTDERCGIARIVRRQLSSEQSIAMIRSFRSIDSQKVIYQPVWGTAIREKNYENALWIRLKEVPVINNWQVPTNLCQLKQICTNQGIDLLAILKSFAPKARDGRRHLLLVGFPIPAHIGEDSHEMTWQAIELPALSCGKYTNRVFHSGKRLSIPQTYGARKGYRPSEAGWWMNDKAKIFLDSMELSWIRSENWSARTIKGRGKLANRLANQRIVMIGLGSLGASIAELLTRAGATQLTCIDGNALEMGNLCRHTLCMTDLYQSKSKLVAKRLTNIDPNIHTTYAERYLDIDETGALVPDLSSFDIIIDSTGEDQVLALLSATEWKRKIVFCSSSVGLGAKRLYINIQRTKLPHFENFLNLVEPYFQKDSNDFNLDALPRDGIGCWHPLFPARADDMWFAACTTVKAFRLTDLIIWIQNCAKWVSDKCSVSFDEICSTWKSFISQKRIISEDDYFLLKRTIFQTLTASKVYKDNLSEWLCYLDKKVGIVSAFTASERYPDEIDNYNKLLETARSHDTQLTIKFLTRLGIPENQVVLTTRHSSKGLEFDVVILPGMEKDSFPSYYDNTPRKLAEARRLCFVSVSRARKACILIRSKNLQNQYGRWFSKEPSPFWVALQEFQDSRSDY